MAIDQAKLEEFIGRFAGDFAAAMHAATVVVGDKLGLYQALAAAGPIDGAGWRRGPATTGGWWRSGCAPST